MTIAPFSIAPALAGGALIGLAAVVLMAFTGRIAGISGIVSGALQGRARDIAWRILFVLGLIVGAMLVVKGFNLRPVQGTVASTTLLIISGGLVGVGTALSAGCTSGHGVCGLARGAIRSLVATVTFMAFGALTVFALRHF
jgi:uncharacterized protein